MQFVNAKYMPGKPVKYIPDFQLSVFTRDAPVLGSRVRQDFFFFLIATKCSLATARELFLNPVINDASQRLLKLFVGTAEQTNVFSKQRSKRLKTPEAIDKITVYFGGMVVRTG